MEDSLPYVRVYFEVIKNHNPQITVLNENTGYSAITTQMPQELRSQRREKLN
jgi:ribosomal protein S7